MSLHEEGIKSILDKLTDSELFGLANTVTEGLARNLNNTREGIYVLRCLKLALMYFNYYFF